MDPHVSLITLGVRDLERAVTFSRDGSGLLLRAGDSGVAFFPLRGVWLALFSRAARSEDAGVAPEGQGLAGVTLAHNVRTNEESDALLEQAVAAGGRLVKAGGPAPGAGTRATSPTPTDTFGRSPSTPRYLELVGMLKAVSGCLRVKDAATLQVLCGYCTARLIDARRT